MRFRLVNENNLGAPAVWLRMKIVPSVSHSAYAGSEAAATSKRISNLVLIALSRGHVRLLLCPLEQRAALGNAMLASRASNRGISNVKPNQDRLHHNVFAERGGARPQSVATLHGSRSRDELP